MISTIEHGVNNVHTASLAHGCLCQTVCSLTRWLFQKKEMGLRRRRRASGLNARLDGSGEYVRMCLGSRRLRVRYIAMRQAPASIGECLHSFCVLIGSSDESIGKNIWDSCNLGSVYICPQIDSLCKSSVTTGDVHPGHFMKKPAVQHDIPQDQFFLCRNDHMQRLLDKSMYDKDNERTHEVYSLDKFH